jgi:uncharacterized protein
MSTGGLSGQAEIRKLAALETIFQGDLKVAELVRFTQALADDIGSVSYILKMGYNDERLPVINGQVSGLVKLECQRCLQPTDWEFESSFTVVIVWDEERVKHVISGTEVIVAPDGMVELLTILEDELLICLPIVAYHPEDKCAMKPGYVSAPDDVEIIEPTSEDSPFKVLQNLKNLKS